MNKLIVVGTAIALFAMCGCGKQSLDRIVVQESIPKEEAPVKKKIESHEIVEATKEESPATATSWQLVQKDQPWMEHLWGVAVVGNNPGYILLRSNSGIFLSMDGGSSWNPASNGLKDKRVREFVSNPGNARIAFGGTGKGLYKTVDGGLNWHLSGKGLPSPHTLAALWMNPDNPQHLLVFDDYLYQSTDGGETWQRKGTRPEDKYVHIMAADPTKPDIILAGTRDKRFSLYRSLDGGVTWETQLQGFTPKQGNVSVIVTDAKTPGTVYVGTGYDGVYKSVDYGVTWSAVNTGLTNSNVMCLIVHPVIPNRIYAGTHAGVFQSRDGGASWSCMGFEKFNVSSLAFSHTHPPRLYAAVHSSVLSHIIGDTAVSKSSNALYRVEQP